MMCIHKVVQQKLHLLQDLQYKSFYAKLVPTVSEDQIIGVRMPLLHKMARELIRCGLAEAFLRELPHTYYEENHLHAFIIGELKSSYLMWITGRPVIHCDLSAFEESRSYLQQK